jgi:hypothetical protein
MFERFTFQELSDFIDEVSAGLERIEALFMTEPEAERDFAKLPIRRAHLLPEPFKSCRTREAFLRATLEAAEQHRSRMA